MKACVSEVNFEIKFNIKVLLIKEVIKLRDFIREKTVDKRMA
jgi:hypothetical protein